MKLSELENLPIEGERGTQTLGKLASELGYDTYPQQLTLPNGTSVSGITNMLEDNPGMVQAIIEFVQANSELYDWDPEEDGAEADGDSEDEG